MDLPKVPTWRLEWDSNQRPSAPKAPITTIEPPRSCALCNACNIHKPRNNTYTYTKYIAFNIYHIETFSIFTSSVVWRHKFEPWASFCISFLPSRFCHSFCCCCCCCSCLLLPLLHLLLLLLLLLLLTYHTKPGFPKKHFYSTRSIFGLC